MNKREWMLHTMSEWIAKGAQGGMDARETIAHLSAVYDAICAATPETPEEGAWVEHDGDVSKAPPAGVWVVAYDRAGTVYQEKADNLVWDHLDCGDDIVRWRYA